MNDTLNPCRTIERTHFVVCYFLPFFRKIVLPLECPRAEEQAVERAGLHNLAEEEAGLEEGNCRMLPVLLILSFLV